MILEYNEQGMVCRAIVWPLSPKSAPPMYSLTCAQCGGDLWAGRNATVCERGCAIDHETPVNWLEKHHPERRIEHSNFRTLLKDVREGLEKLKQLELPRRSS